jgi:3-hydroxyisobutyrate dehydrogenase-like beta-hydroxyacid dehydrogenase
MIPMRVGFAGLGRMGTPMAARIAEFGFPLTVWNRTAGRSDPLASRGARIAGTLRDLAAGSNVVITMLSDGAAARSVWTGPGGLLEACAPGTIGIDMSTTGPQAAREIAARAEAAGVPFLDAPVSGSVAVAEQGRLTTMVGGEPTVLARALPVLQAITANQLHLGPPGAGAAMKLAVNIMIAVVNQAVAEGLALTAAAGIDPRDAYDAFLASAVSSPFLRYKRDAYLSPGDEPVSFTTALMAKDLQLALDIATACELPLALTVTAKQSLDRACADGFGDADFACLARLLRPGNAST